MNNNSLSRLPKGFLMSYYRYQSNEVKDNIRRALGLSSFVSSQLPDNQVVTTIEKKS